MTADDETKILQSFYDRIYEMVTYTPTSGSGVGISLFDPKTTLVQLETDGSINFDDYKDMLTPINVTGDLRASEAFYRLIDLPGGIGATYKANSGGSIGEHYKEIIDGANADPSTQPTEKEITEYNHVQSYLFTTIDQEDPLTGDKKEVTIPTENYRNYSTYKSLYVNALSAYRSAYLSYDMTKPEDQRNWEAKVPVLEGNLTTAWQNWETLGNKSNVEEAINFLAASDNNIVANIIADTQSTLAAAQLSSLLQTGDHFYLCYGSPFTWHDNSQTAGWMTFTLNQNNLYTSDSSYYKKTQGSAGSSFLGLISWGGHGDSTTQEKNHHMQGDNLSITCEMLTVTIERPWFTDELFKTEKWYLSGQPQNWISDGSLDEANANAFMPVVPSAIVIVKNVAITANWTTQDSQSLSTATSASGGFSFGPFHAGGGGGSNATSSSSNSTFTGGTLTIPDPQIVAWISQIVPPSPPEATPST